MGIGAGYGGSLKGSGGFNQSAFGRASQTAGQNIKQGLNYSPTLPQHESGGSQGYTRSVLSEGNITIGGKKTSARALGIHTDSATAHHGADSVPDLQNLLDKQQTVAQSTAVIHSAVATYSGNRAKAAAEELEKQQAAYEGRLKEQNDGSYEQYAGKSDSERLSMRLGNAKYAQAYQEARSWGVGGSKSRALSAAETLITGALGGQGDLQLAANTLAPYAAAAIGKRFGHGENKNEAAQAISHFMLGAALAYANGADPLAGGSAAVAAERAAEYLAKQYDDGRTAIDPITGKFNPNLLPEHIKEEIKAQTGAVASVVGAAGGILNGTNGANTNALFNAQVGGVLGQNAVENNALNRLDGFTPGERSLRARADKIYQNNPKGKDLYIRSYEAYELEASYLAAKEIVVGTWEGIRHPWDNTIVPLAEAVSSPVQTVNKVVMSYENWKAVRDEAYINDPQLAGRMDAMFDARVGTNAAFMVVSGGTASAIVRSRAAAKVVKSAGNLSKNGKLKFGPSSLSSSALKVPVPVVREIGDISQKVMTPIGSDATYTAKQVMDNSGKFIKRTNTRGGVLVQPNQSVTCGQHSCGMLLNTLKRNVPLYDLLKIYPPDVLGKGSSPALLQRILKDNGIKSSYNRNVNIEHTAKWFSHGKPAIAIVKTSPVERHAVVIDGITQRGGKTVVAIRDPAGYPNGGLYYETIQSFKNRFTGEIIRITE